MRSTLALHKVVWNPTNLDLQRNRTGDPGLASRNEAMFCGTVRCLLRDAFARCVHSAHPISPGQQTEVSRPKRLDLDT